MNQYVNINTLTETQKNALFAFGQPDKTATSCNLKIAASMREGDLTGAILMTLMDLINSAGITADEFTELIQEIRLETEANIQQMEKDYLERTGKVCGDLPWRGFARRKILAAFGSDSCGHTVSRLDFVHHVTVDPEVKKLVPDLRNQVADMNVFRQEAYPALLAEARKMDDLWRIKTDDLGYFTVKK